MNEKNKKNIGLSGPEIDAIHYVLMHKYNFCKAKMARDFGVSPQRINKILKQGEGVAELKLENYYHILTIIKPHIKERHKECEKLCEGLSDTDKAAMKVFSALPPESKGQVIKTIYTEAEKGAQKKYDGDGSQSRIMEMECDLSQRIANE